MFLYISWKANEHFVRNFRNFLCVFSNVSLTKAVANYDLECRQYMLSYELHLCQSWFNTTFTTRT